MTSVACFGGGLSVVFRLVFVRCAFGSVWVVGWPPFGDGCPLGWPFGLVVCRLFVVFVCFPFGFGGGFWLLVAPVPVYCFYITLIILTNVICLIPFILLVTHFNFIFVSNACFWLWLHCLY